MNPNVKAQNIQANPLLNPLAKHFRQPAIYLQLPSNGKFWPEGTLELPMTGKLPIYPMTTKDEITLKTPDALIDGTSVVTVVQSCCPGVKNAWELPSIDLDAILIAIRIASYGNAMSLESKCPHCGEENEYDVDLNNILANVHAPNYDEPLVVNDDITIKLRPMTYQQISKNGSAAFEQQRYIQSIADNKDMEEKEMRTRYTVHLEKLLELTVDNLVFSTESITMGGTEIVTNPAYIREYYINADGHVTKVLQDKIKEFAKMMAIKPINVTCSECEKEYTMNVEFDYASFFGQGF